MERQRRSASEEQMFARPAKAQNQSQEHRHQLVVVVEDKDSRQLDKDLL